MTFPQNPTSSNTPTQPPRVAVVVIHGMGEQLPMETLRGFVETVWQTDDSLFAGLPPIPEDSPEPRRQSIFSKPDLFSGSTELRRLATLNARDPANPSNQEPQGPRADFFELHWSDVTADSSWGDFISWLLQLLRRNPFKLPVRVRFPWFLLWAIVLVIGAVSLSSAYQTFTSSKAWAVIVGVAAVGVVVLKKWITSYFGDVARYVSAKPRNIPVRHEARMRGLRLLDGLTESGRYQRIVIVGHSLGSILAHDVAALAWSRVVGKLDISEKSDLWKAVGKCEEAARDLLDSAGYPKVKDIEEGTREGIRAGLRKAKPNPDKLRTYRKLQRDLFRELAKHSLPSGQAAWLISDIVTVGSPLTHADFLLAQDSSELEKMTYREEVLRCPPVMEATTAMGRVPRFVRESETGSRNWRFRHAAAFAPTRWTNIYDESGPVLFLSGDMISGRLSRDFGPGVVDAPVKIRRARRICPRWITHTLYWRYQKEGGGEKQGETDGTALDMRGGAPEHINVLRRAVNVLDDPNAEEELLKYWESKSCDRAQ